MDLNGQGSNRPTLLVITAITAASLSVWLGGLFLLWLLLRSLGSTTDFWVMVEALSTATAVAALLVTGYAAYRELAEVASTRHMAVADRLFEELNAPENVEARRWVYQNLGDDPQEGMGALTPQGRVAVKQVLDSLDRIAFLTQTGWIPETMVMPWMSTMVVKAWTRLEPYIEYERERRGEPDYYANVGALAGRCHAWRARNIPEAAVKWIEDAL